jgi:hypothetical protein
MGYGPVSALYQDSFAARLSRLLSASRKTILLQSEFGESFRGTVKIIGLQVSPSCRHGNLPLNAYSRRPSDYSAVTLEVDFLCFSSGGQHPSANEPTLVVSDVSRAGGVDLGLGLDLEIRDDLLAVLGYRLSIFAWKTGQNIAVSDIGFETHLAPLYFAKM